jgi:hypothetical protein
MRIKRMFHVASTTGRRCPTGPTSPSDELLTMTSGLFDDSADQGFQHQAFLVDGNLVQQSHEPSRFVAHVPSGVTLPLRQSLCKVMGTFVNIVYK